MNLIIIQRQARFQLEFYMQMKELFLKMNGPEPYMLIANSLATEEFMGKNLTTAKEMGAFRKFLNALGYRYWDESANPAYRMFLAQAA